jgi:hexulose-6-phosphate isomerase
MARIGIMQGRLLPPEDNRIQYFPREDWADEFSLAAAAGLDSIEWIFDACGADVNPLATDAGVELIRSMSASNRISVLSVCADYFMDEPLVRADAGELKMRLDTLRWLMHRCRLLGMNRLVLPFVDASHIDTDAELESVVSTLDLALKTAEETGMEIHLETSLPPSRFAELLRRVPHPMLKVNYDSGNSASLGYRPQEEFEAYGARVGSVHIKDRVLGGETVPLGTGHADFAAVFDGLRRVDYSGDFILQAARGTPGGEVVWARRNRAFIQKHWPQNGKSEMPGEKS